MERGMYRHKKQWVLYKAISLQIYYTGTYQECLAWKKTIKVALSRYLSFATASEYAQLWRGRHSEGIKQ
jgi:hypothetical protein